VAEVSVIPDDGQDAVDGVIDEPRDPAEPSADEWARMTASGGEPK
jgi:hypothetical protein